LMKPKALIGADFWVDIARLLVLRGVMWEITLLPANV
jgi:hypothetical protein